MGIGCLSEQLSKAVDSLGSNRSEGGRLVRRLAAECLAAILAVLVAFAYASPPDPSWIPGIYDYHDFDDVVGMVTDGAGVSASPVTQRVECVFVGFVLRTATRRIPGPILHRQTIRGPPIETDDASADPLLTPVLKALPPSRVRLIVPAFSRKAAIASSHDLRWSSPPDHRGDLCPMSRHCYSPHDATHRGPMPDARSSCGKRPTTRCSRRAGHPGGDP